MPDATTPNATSPDTASPAPRGAPIFEDFIDIFYAPAQVFARRINGNWFIPMVVVTVVVTLLYFFTRSLMQPVFDAEFMRQSAATLKANPKLTQAQMNQGRAMFEKLGWLFVMLGVPFSMFVTGLALWVVGKFVGAVQTITSALVVASYAWFPRILESVINAVQAMLIDPASIKGRFSLSLGVGRFLDPDTASPILVALLGRVDVFTIWVTVLLAIGLKVTGKVTTAQATIAGVVVWILGALPQIFSALRQ